jgi:hypothetical protein
MNDVQRRVAADLLVNGLGMTDGIARRTEIDPIAVHVALKALEGGGWVSEVAENCWVFLDEPLPTAERFHGVKTKGLVT